MVEEVIKWAETIVFASRSVPGGPKGKVYRYRQQIMLAYFFVICIILPLFVGGVAVG